MSTKVIDLPGGLGEAHFPAELHQRMVEIVHHRIGGMPIRMIESMVDEMAVVILMNKNELMK